MFCLALIYYNSYIDWSDLNFLVFDTSSLIIVGVNGECDRLRLYLLCGECPSLELDQLEDGELYNNNVNNYIIYININNRDDRFLRLGDFDKLLDDDLLTY